MRTFTPLPFAALLACLSACQTTEPILTCESTEDCPSGQSCLQQSCLSMELPDVHVLTPEDTMLLTYGDGTMVHTELLVVTASNLTLRSRADSSEAVPGEGYLVVFVDEIEVGTIEDGDLEGGVQLSIDIPDQPGAHRIRVQARLNDGTDYDNEGGASRSLVWVDDGRQHVALRQPWPNDAFSLETQLINGEAAAINGITIGPPSSGNLHVMVFYDEIFPACFDDSVCMASYNGIVPSDDNDFGPVLLPEAATGTVTLTAAVFNPDHTLYFDELGEPVWSSIEIVRTDN